MSLTPERESDFRDYAKGLGGRIEEEMGYESEGGSALIAELLDEIDRLRDCLKGHKLAINNLNDGLNLLKKTYGLLDEIKHFKHKKELQ